MGLLFISLLLSLIFYIIKIVYQEINIENVKKKSYFGFFKKYWKKTSRLCILFSYSFILNGKNIYINIGWE